MWQLGWQKQKLRILDNPRCKHKSTWLQMRPTRKRLRCCFKHIPHLCPLSIEHMRTFQISMWLLSYRPIGKPKSSIYHSNARRLLSLWSHRCMQSKHWCHSNPLGKQQWEPQGTCLYKRWKPRVGKSKASRIWAFSWANMATRCKTAFPLQWTTDDSCVFF